MFVFTDDKLGFHFSAKSTAWQTSNAPLVSPTKLENMEASLRRISIKAEELSPLLKNIKEDPDAAYEGIKNLSGANIVVTA